MPKHKRNTYRKQPNLLLKRTSTASRFAFPLLAVLGAVFVAALIILSFLTPSETQSSIDPSSFGFATRHNAEEDSEQEGRQDELAEQNGTEAENAGQAQNENEPLPETDAPREPEITRMTDTIRSGDTPTTLLEGHLGLAEIHALCDESKDVYPLHNLRAGQPWTMIYSDNALVGLEYEIDANERLVVCMTDTGYDFRREAIPYDVQRKTVSGVIESSFFGAVAQAGESEDLALRLANIFAYDVDFMRDLRTGDTFTAIVEKRFREGNFAGYGELSAASFTNQGQTYHAYRFTDSRGNTAYYDQNGRPLRKAFLKSPLPFTRISSGYSMKRMHPVLNYVRPHQGIDYAAPTGTPISTVADGVILQVGSNGSQGRFVVVAHSNGYETIYNHMSKFAKIAKKGAKVKQGAVIGYVGSSGLSTGPHLDFRMKQNGALINPLKLKSMPADPIAAREMPAFKAAIADARSELERQLHAANPAPNPAQ